MAELNLWLDSYDDIYSDFDSRQYMKRRVSEDFIHELRTEMRYTKDHAGNLVLLLPAEKRNEIIENTITASLVEFFERQAHFHRERSRNKRNRGILLLIAGLMLMLLSAWVSLKTGRTFFTEGLKVFFEPAGWFLLWAAFDFLLYDFPQLKRDEGFYKKLSEMHIQFKSS